MILTALLLMIQTTASMEAAPVFAVVTETAPVIDGVPSEAAWEQAVVVDAPFIQHRPVCGEPLSEGTEVRLLYDGEMLYIAFTLHDSMPECFTRMIAPRDNDFSSEWAGIWLDTYNDDNNAYFFFVNVDNVQQDGRLSEVAGWDMDWDAVWESSTACSDSGWTAELAIPFSALRYSGDPEQVWGVNFKRTITRTNESGFLYPMADNGSVRIEDFGDLLGLSGLPDSRELEFRPYGASRLTRDPGDGEKWDLWGNAGMDCRVGLGSSTVLDLTLNPDFGQVEADPDQVNLSHWETYLREKRPFFLEGSDLFEMPFTLFYSRRIGAVASNGEIIPILGGAKVTGSSGGFRYGALEAYTGRVSDSDGTVEPATNYAVTRVLREFGTGSFLGISMTSTDIPAEDGTEYAYGRSGAVDCQVQFLDHHTLSAAVAGTWNSSMEAWEDNLAYRSWYSYGDERLNSSVGISYREDDFDANPAGYTSSTGAVCTWAEAGLYMPTPGNRTLDHGWLDAYYSYNQVPGGSITARELYLDAGVVFSNRYHAGIWTSISGSWRDVYEGPEGRGYGAGTNWGCSFSSDSRRKLYVYLYGGLGNYRDGSSANIGIWLNYKPVSTVSLGADIDWNSTSDAERYNWQAGDWDIRSTDWRSLELSGSYMFSTDLSLSLVSQLSRFDSDWDLTGRSVSESHWMNLLLSWSFRPGSMFYLLAGEDAEPADDGSFGEPGFTIFSKVTWFI